MGGLLHFWVSCILIVSYQPEQQSYKAVWSEPQLRDVAVNSQSIISLYKPQIFPLTYEISYGTLVRKYLPAALPGHTAE